MRCPTKSSENQKTSLGYPCVAMGHCGLCFAAFNPPQDPRMIYTKYTKAYSFWVALIVFGRRCSEAMR
jgi:hypothetical protein